MLVPEFIKTLPKDPFTGKQFLYSRKDGRFLLYSAGTNLTDNGGSVYPEKEGRFLIDDDDGDLIIVRPPVVK